MGLDITVSYVQGTKFLRWFMQPAVFITRSDNWCLAGGGGRSCFGHRIVRLRT